MHTRNFCVLFPNVRLFYLGSLDGVERNNSAEIETIVETHICKLCVIRRSRVQEQHQLYDVCVPSDPSENEGRWGRRAKQKTKGRPAVETSIPRYKVYRSTGRNAILQNEILVPSVLRESK